MNKKVKIGIITAIIVLTILVVVLLVLNINSSKKNGETIIPTYTSKKISKYIDTLGGDYYMKYIVRATDNPSTSTGVKMEDVVTEFATQDGKTFVSEPIYNTAMLITKNAVYYIMHDEKKIYKQEVPETSTESTPTPENNSSELQKLTLVAYFEEGFQGTGTEEIDGVPYYYEEYKGNSGTDEIVRYYFDSEDKLKFMKNENSEDSSNSLTEVLELSSDVNSEIFELPKDYEELGIEELYKSLYSNIDA